MEQAETRMKEAFEMKSTHQWLIPTVTAVSLIVTMPVSFVATDGNKIVVEVKRVGAGSHRAGEHSRIQPGSTVTVITAHADIAREEALSRSDTDDDSTKPLSAVSLANSVGRWVSVGLHLTVAVLILCSGHVTLSM